MDQSEIENILHHLNYRWNLEALAIWKGDKLPFKPHEIYESYNDFISLETLSHIDELEDRHAKTRLRFALIDHYLQRALLPHETEMRAWMQGASAHVHDEKIRFREIITWCQKDSTYEKRKVLAKETGPLCKFLRVFAINYWDILLKILENEFGFKDYVDYCGEKKGIDYHHYYLLVKDLLHETDELYFAAMEQWSREHFNLPLDALSRFDAINLLGLCQFDAMLPPKDLKEMPSFFQCWGIDLNNFPGLHLDLGHEDGKSAQAMCFILQAPEEVYIMIKPQGGWVDVETLWHELGHGLSAIFVSPELSMVDKDMATSYNLSESFAFLLQNMALSAPFLKKYFGLNLEDSEKIAHYKVLRDFSLFRRYAAKFLAEYEMFNNGDISNGEVYSQLMVRHTGFCYQPECHLFDLAPEFYCLDYLLAWMAEANMEEYLSSHLGDNWMFRKDTGSILKKWWGQGNLFEIDRFLDQNDLGHLTPDRLLKRWKRVSVEGPGNH